MTRPVRSWGVVALVALVVPLLVAAEHAPAPLCEPGGPAVAYEGEEEPDDAQTYRLLPFEVSEETTRIAVQYDWGSDDPTADEDPLRGTTIDLGVWDQHGPFDAEGFRGWSGSRHRDVTISAGEATRGYLAAPIEPGIWHVELGVAAVDRNGGWWEVEITCHDDVETTSPSGTAGQPDPVDPDHVASTEPGWFHGDLHMHAYHSAPDAPDWDEFVAFAREQQLDFLPITEYVTSAHWYELGAVQRDHPDLLVWPGREIITYHGHAIALGETWDTIEYRHGFEDITMAEIQRDTIAEGALFQVAHPTTFEGEVFEQLCRGCPWELEPFTDWDTVHTIEVLTGPAVVYPTGQQDAAGFENPFMREAIEMWEDLLNDGYRITAVGGSDDKWAGERTDEFGTISPHGVPATAVHSEELSRAGLTEALLAGRAYVRSLGVEGSPALEMTAVTDDGEEATFGGELTADSAELTVEVTDGAGQLLVLYRNAEEQVVVPVTGDEFEHTLTVERDPGSEGPLGTWWRVETLDPATGPPMVATTVGNPIFLVGGAAPAPSDNDVSDPRPDDEATAPLPETGAGSAWFLAILLLGAGALLGWDRLTRSA